jgi:hypothetical protein
MHSDPSVNLHTSTIINKMGNLPQCTYMEPLRMHKNKNNANSKNTYQP